MVHGFAMLRLAGKKIFEIMYWFSVSDRRMMMPPSGGVEFGGRPEVLCPLRFLGQGLFSAYFQPAGPLNVGYERR